ncbi:hypothetical protein GL218_07891 [Daldinia childiae]|uniref:uncharacterized protein n=1 Tax=Daldinia childiae TaxID=326645 RepID=UPI0014450A21|nr:uncharacterized protein GL218_07891 [Daldinia childiae]KAF3069675.1 hypothetical protein GL218_07891 [Daldinia childiae]
MDSLGYALATADSLNNFVHSEIKATDNKVTNSKEAKDAKDAKAMAMSAVKSTISLVDSTLAKLRSIPSPNGPKSRTKCTPSASYLGFNHTLKESGEHPARRTSNEATLRDPWLPPDVQALITTMSANKESGLGSQYESLSDMAFSIEPIVDNFNEVLNKPYLEDFSATLNTVPVIGLKNKQIVYLDTQLDLLAKSGTKDVWKSFAAFPTDANLSADSNIHFFPYKGDFYLSVGTAVWRKRHIFPHESTLTQSVGNWPKLYRNDWERIGDSVFPADDLRDVIPFAKLNPTRREVGFELLILNQDSSIQVLAKDDIYGSNTWNTISYIKGKDDPSAPPMWSRMAYWSNSIVALDDQNNTWSLKVNFEAGTYTIADKTPIESTSEFTATDLGPVTVRSDGYLYKRYLQDPPSDGTDPAVKWSKWVRQDGVTNLGVASPGVVLDLRVLTRTLKERYIETQTTLYPLVNKINAFSIAHTFYLDNLRETADKWALEPDDKKREQAIESGKRFVNHAKVWSMILNRSILNTNNAVNIMTAQLQDVKSQLEIQLQLLKDKLLALNNTLDVQKDALSKLNAAFWGSVALTLLGLVTGVLLVATGVGAPYAIAAGALFVGGLVSTIILSVKITELKNQMFQTQSQIRVTNVAISQLASVVANFTELDRLYTNLNRFWGGMGNQADALGAMDDVTAFLLGEKLLDDTSSIDAGLDITKNISRAAFTYLDVLNKQGIIIPDELTVAKSQYRTKLAKTVSIATNENLDALFYATVELARDALSHDKLDKYENLMEDALSIVMRKTDSLMLDKITSSIWYDTRGIKNAAALFNNSALCRTSLSNIIGNVVGITGTSDPTAIENCINTAAPVVIGMLYKTMYMCQDIQDLLDRYKKANGGKEEIDKLKNTLLETAIDNCTKAQMYAARANTAFNDVNHAATDYQEYLNREINYLKAIAASATTSANKQIQDIDIPSCISLGGRGAILAYKAVREDEKQRDLSRRLRDISSSINGLMDLISKGNIIDGHNTTWIEMVQTINSCLGVVHKLLTTIQGHIREDITIYESLLDVEWTNVQEESNEILDILASRGIDTSPPKDVVNSHSVDLVVQRRSPIAPASEIEARVVEALTAPGKLDTAITSQAEKAKSFFAEIEKLLKSPYLSGIVGYWDTNQIEKSSLLDVVSRLRSQYVDMISNEYPVILNMYTTSLLQETRARNVKSGELRIDIFVSSSLQSARYGQKAASTAAGKFRASSADYAFVLKQVQANLEQIKEKLEEVDQNIDELKKERRNLIIGLIADVFAMTFATAILLAGFAFLGPVSIALTTVEALGLGATATAATIAGVIDSLKLADIIALIGVLQNTKRDLNVAYEGLGTIRPLFKNVLDAAEGMESVVTKMADRLEVILCDVELLKQVKLSKEDVEEIGKAWTDVKDGCIFWMDTINAQGINPATL